MNQIPEPTSPLEDPRIQFFLENEEQILEWAALAPEVFDAVESTLRLLSIDLREQADQDVRLGEEVRLETFRAPTMFRNQWCQTGPGIPDVGIGIGWDNRVDPAGIWRPSSLPYFGIRTARSTNAGQAIEEALRTQYRATPALLNRDGVNYKRGSYWTVYRFSKSMPGWWQDVPAWRQAMANELLATWSHWESIVSDVVSR